jgi:N-acetylmuramoyl-L-alanine amidase
VVVIDPGHGGTDTGAMGQKLSEKTVVLDIARRVRERLRRLNIDVRLTRDTDTALTLSERTAAAQQQGATLFLSIHMNSARNASASGLETYVVTAPGFVSTAGENGASGAEPGNRFDADSIVLAYETHRAVLEQTGAADRGVKHARFDVLSQAPCPAALIECGFLSNAYEENMISMKAYRGVLAEGIADGIMAYIRNTGALR